jgi:methionyl-tRNA formyltransferase
MRVAFFGAGSPLSRLALAAVASEHEVVAVVHPVPADLPRRMKWRASSLLRGRGPLGGEYGLRRLQCRGSSDASLRERLGALNADVICIAAWPWLLPPALFTLPRLGALNLHPSLLPRHRGPNPLFWTYYHGDEEAGVTVHRVDAGADTGDILAQTRVLVERGLPLSSLYHQLAACGASLLRESLRALEEGRDTGTPQREAEATWAPRVKPGTPMVDWSWPAARIWHFLAGVFPHYKEPLRGPEGEPVDYGGVAGFDGSVCGLPPGTVRRTEQGWLLACADGCVHLTRGSGT